MRKVLAMFTYWASDTDQNKIQPVLQKFTAYCQPLKNVPFERYKFYSRMQESGESYDHYQTALRQLVERFEFESITPNQILHDKLVFGIRNTMVQQMRVVGNAGLSVADAGNGMLCLKSLKEGNVGPVVAQEMLTRGQIVVNFADMSMTLQSVRTVQLLEGAAISVARKIISQKYVLDTRQSPRLTRILCIVSKMSFRTKFLECKKFRL